MFRAVSLAIFLFGFWLLLSGHFTPFLVVSGAIAAIAVAGLGLAFGYADEEGHPVHLLARGLSYWPWLVKEIVKSAIEVAGIVVSPALPISPRLIRVKTSQKTTVGIATYANSITLTPGTITVEVAKGGSEFLVHALTGSGAEGLAAGEMDRRVTAMEGAP